MFRHVTTRFAGLVIVIAGVWGGLIPFLGPTFHFTLGPDDAWRWTTGRLWLDVLPAAAAVLGGLILMGRGPRVSGHFGALLALAGGVWFAVGPDVSMLWNHGVSQAGATHGHHTITRMLELLTLHSGIGALITALAAYSLPGVPAVGVRRRHVAADAAVAGTGAAAGAAETRHRDHVAAREAGATPVGAGAAGTGAGTAAGAGFAGAGAGSAAGAGFAGAGAGSAAGAAEARHRENVATRENEPVAPAGAAGGTPGGEPVAPAGAAGGTPRGEPVAPAGAAGGTPRGEPAAAGAAGGTPRGEPAAAAPAGDTATQPVGGATARPDQPVGGEAVRPEEPVGGEAGTGTPGGRAPRRRGGLAGLFSRR